MRGTRSSADSSRFGTEPMSRRSRDVVELQWYASDGYVNNGRTQAMQVEASNYEGMTKAEIREQLEEEMGEDFGEKVTPSPLNFDAVVDTIYNAVGADDAGGEEE